MARKTYLLAELLVGVAVLFCVSAEADDEMDEASLRNARQAESQGRFVEAIAQYNSLAHSTYSIDLSRLAMRRALALQICEVKKGNSSVSADSIYASYSGLKQLEPDNPTWPYLQAMYKLQVRQQYFDVFPLFHQAINCKGGEESVRQKAIADLNKYRPIINARVDQENAITKKKDWDWDHGGKERYESGLNAMIRSHAPAAPRRGSSEPKRNGDWASSQNAQKAGDWGAASRLQNGTSTWNDRNSYTRY